MRKALYIAIALLLSLNISESCLASRLESGEYDYILETGNAIIIWYYGLEEDVIVPEALDGHPVIGIGHTELNASGFSFGRTLTSITLPNSLTFIGNNIFSHCIELTSITIPESVTFIGKEAFYGCTKLDSITIPDSVTHIGSYAFEDCLGLTSVTIPENVIDIGNCVFMGCKNLTTAQLMSRNSGTQTFFGCSKLSTVMFGEKFNSIEFGLFSYCNSLEQLNIPENVSDISYHPFVGSGLTNIIIENPNIEFEETPDYSLKLLPKAPTFYGCDNLTTIYAFNGSQAQRYASEKRIGFVPIAKVNLNGRDLKFDVPAQIIGDRTLVPMRKIFEELGAVVGWDEASQTVTAAICGKDITMRIGDSKMQVGGRTVALDVPPQVVLSRTLVPVQTVCESLGASVQWDDAAQTVLITTG